MSDETELLGAAWNKLTPQQRTAFAKWYAEHGRLLLSDEGRGAEPVPHRRASDWTEEQVRKADEMIRKNQRRSTGIFRSPEHGERANGGGEK